MAIYSHKTNTFARIFLINLRFSCQKILAVLVLCGPFYLLPNLLACGNTSDWIPANTSMGGGGGLAHQTRYTEYTVFNVKATAYNIIIIVRGKIPQRSVYVGKE